MCDAGYDGDGVTCTNIDECADASLNNCDANASCTDDAGSFSCVCDAGYMAMVSRAPISMSAPMLRSMGSENATCSDEPGSFSCVCDDYYEGDGVTCTDIDECQTENGGCGDPVFYTCTNVEGGPPVS